MTSEVPGVNIDTRKSYLLLSAVGDDRHHIERASTEPAEAALRDERDPLTAGLLREKVNVRPLPLTESELRALWGDR